MTNYTQQRNREFQRANTADKRRMIAEDVIMQLNNRVYYAASAYVDANNNSTCTVCGIGSCLVSMERLKDPLKNFMEISEEVEYGDQKGKEGLNKLAKYFSKRQLALIEDYFEQSCEGEVEDYYEGEKDKYDIGGWYEIKVTKKTLRSYLAAKKYFCRLSPRGRLIRIMENIVRNGKFDPQEEVRFRTQPITPISETRDFAKLAQEFQTADTEKRPNVKNIVKQSR